MVNMPCMHIRHCITNNSLTLSFQIAKAQIRLEFSLGKLYMGLELELEDTLYYTKKVTEWV